RVLTIAETILNGITATKIFAPDNQANIPFANLVTGSTTFSTLNYSGTAPVNAHQAIALKSFGGRTIIYLIDDNGGSPVIRKYRSNAGGSTWIALGNISVPVGTKSLTATISATGAKIYFITL